MENEESFTKLCPECNSTMVYSKRRYLLESISKNLVCRPCGRKKCADKLLGVSKKPMSDRDKANIAISKLEQNGKIPEQQLLDVANGLKLWNDLEWIRQCPECSQAIKYSHVSSYRKAVENNSICLECSGRKSGISSRGKKTHIGPFVKKCFECDEIIVYQSYSALQEGIKNNTWCHSCKYKHQQFRDEHTKAKMSVSQKLLADQKVSRKIVADIDFDRNQIKGPLNTWSTAVRNRDGYNCVICGSSDDLQAHHIFSVALHPELSLNLNNGITLCRNCHYQEHQLNGLK